MTSSDVQECFIYLKPFWSVFLKVYLLSHIVFVNVTISVQGH